MSETDTTGLRLLSLDGGGIRGLSTLLILEAIMHRIKTEENLKDMPRPCDYFDLIGGTSTGGIIALILGRLRMSVADAIDCYDNISGSVFSKLNWWGDGKYKAELLEEEIKKVVKQRTGDSEAQLLDDGALGGVCKTFVCAMNAHNMNACIPVLFRTYESPKEPSIPCTVWQAARATSAAPTIFKRVRIGPAARREPFIDGGVGRNNPTSQVLEEAELMFPNRKITCVISIGTGKPETIDAPNPSFFERNVVPVGVIKAMAAMATDCEKTAQEMEKKFKHLQETYFRFNVEQGLQKVNLASWDRMDEVAAHTRSYMSMHEVDRSLSTAVKVIRERKGVISTLAINSIQAIHQLLKMREMDTILAVEFSLDELNHLMRDANIGLEKKVGDVQETMNDGFQAVMARFDLKDGRPPMVFSAAFESLDPHKIARCFPGTRGGILDQLHRWISVEGASDSTVSNSPVFWINGSAGTGKTTLAYTFADNCKRGGIPVTSFFCSRDFAERSNPNLIFTSIAHHLSQTFPSFGVQLAEVLRLNPHLTSASVPYQLEELIINPLRSTRNSFRLCLIVIDALDECKDEGTTSIILSSLSRYVSEISPLKILVTSRPEQSITSVFASRSGHLNAASQRLVLHEQELGIVRQDIKLYLSSGLREVADHYGLNETWPLKQDIESLATLSFGLFIFAATSIKFIEDRNDSDPRGQLTRLLSGKQLSAHAQSSPHHRLDKLYMEVLTHAFPDITIQLSGRLKMILGSIVSLQEPLSPVSLEDLLGLPPGVVRQTLVHLRSILILPDSNTQSIRLHHPSFVDFITDSNRCCDVRFTVDSKKQHTLLAIQCLKAMRSLKQDICGINNPCILNSEVENPSSRIADNIVPHIQYACRHWIFHLTHSLASDILVNALKEFCTKYLLYWIEVCSLLGELRSALVGLHAAKEFLLKQDFVDLVDIISLLDDCERFNREFFSVLDIACLQVYHSALHFTPRQTTLWNLYEHKRLPFGSSSSCIEQTWSPCLRIMEGHSTRVRHVAFSPDGTQIVSGSADKTLRLWDAVSGAHLNTFNGHSSSVESVTFSPDGTQLVSGSEDKTIRLWDAVSGAHLSTFNGHSDGVRSVTFSPDGTRIISGSEDNTLRLWDTVSGAHLNTLSGHSNWAFSVAFSSDGTRIVSGSWDNTLRLWDAVSGAHLNTINGHSSPVTSVTFSPDGTQIVSGSKDKTLRLCT